MADQPIARFEKAPAAKLPYTVDWAGWLPVGETIASVIWDAGELTVDNTGNTATTATVRLSGGAIGEVHSVKCSIVTAPSGYEDARTFVVRCVDR